MKRTNSTKAAARSKYQKKQEVSWKQWAYQPSRAIEGEYTRQFSCIASNAETRLKFLVNSGAFGDFRDPSKPAKEQEDVQTLLNAWVEDNEDCRVFKHPKSRAALKHDTKGYEIPAPPESLNFRTIPSDECATLVLDRENVVLAYKFRMPQDLHQKLVESQLFLSQAKRANYSLWAKSTEEIAMSSDYRKQLPESENFFGHNRDLWNVLNDVLRLIDPVMYKKYTNVDQFLKEGEKRLAGAWHGAIINRQTGSQEEAVPHKNWKDWGKGLTAMIPWGDYEGGDVKLYNLGLMLEMKPCDVLLVNARCVSYGVQEVARGVRNELDLAVQGTTIKWRHEMVTNGALRRAEERKRIERKRRNREKEEQRRPHGRSAFSGGVGNGQRQTKSHAARPPTATDSNAIPLGTKVEDGHNAKSEEIVSTATAEAANSNMIPLGARNTNVQASTKTEQENNSTVVTSMTNIYMQPKNTPAADIVQKVLREDRLESEAAVPPATANIPVPEPNIALFPNKIINQRNNSKQARMKEALEKAVMDSISTGGKTSSQIEKDQRVAMDAYYRTLRSERKKRYRPNKAATKAACLEQGLAEGKTGKETTIAMQAEKVERGREQASERKKELKRQRAIKHNKIIAARRATNGKAPRPASVERERPKRMRPSQQRNSGENASKKPKVEAGNDLTAWNMPTIKPDMAPTSKLKSESAPKREVTRENVGGKMREVVCLD